MEEEGFRTSLATCLHCGYEWVAVVPDECVDALECPACHCRWGIEEPSEEDS